MMMMLGGRATATFATASATNAMVAMSRSVMWGNVAARGALLNVWLVRGGRGSSRFEHAVALFMLFVAPFEHFLTRFEHAATRVFELVFKVTPVFRSRP